MTPANVLPEFDDCINLYLTAYEQYGTEPFTPDQLDVGSVDEDQRLLELGVAYGFLEFDGTSYNVKCEPGASAERWQSVATARVMRIQRAIGNCSGIGDASDVGDPEGLTFEGETFASAFVTESDNFNAIADTVSSVSTNDHNGVVLRSPADLANEVQRFADCLCDPSEVSETPLSASLKKEYTDVVGDQKDDLEFRLFLSHS